MPLRRSAAFLPDADYLRVAMPTDGVHLLQLLRRDGRALSRYSELTTVLAVPPRTRPPTTVTAETVADTAVNVNRARTVSVGLSTVSALVQAFGGDGTLDLSVDRVRSVEYAYTALTSDRVDLAGLDAWLGVAELATLGRATGELLAAGQLYVIVGVLKARELSVALRDDRGNALAVDATALQHTVGGTIEVSGSRRRRETVGFRAANPLVVAAKCVQIRADRSGLCINPRSPAGEEVRDLPDATSVYDDELELRLD